MENLYISVSHSVLTGGVETIALDGAPRIHSSGAGTTPRGNGQSACKPVIPDFFIKIFEKKNKATGQKPCNLKNYLLFVVALSTFLWG